MSPAAFQMWPAMRRVERAARSTISKCQKALRLDSVPMPIPVEEWIEGPLGIRFGVCDLSHLGDGVLGAVDIPGREIMVSESLAEHDARLRFTAAHELGHFVLHAAISPRFRDDVHLSAFLDRRFEREADRFAAAFLIPNEFLCIAYAEECQLAGAEPNALLAAIRTGVGEAINLFASRIVGRLARRFGVSRTALVHRFADLYAADGSAAIPPTLVGAIVQRPSTARHDPQ